MEWQLARQWVISTGVALDNRNMQSSESLCDFVISLRDGDILCGVAHAMRPYCLEYRTQKIENIDQHEFLCKRNITIFLRTCRDVFYIKSKDLFEASDLYNMTNFVAVVNTLSVLSHHKEAIAIQGCRPFSVVSKRCKEDDHHMYGSLVDEIHNEESLAYKRDTRADIYDEQNYCNSAYDSLIYGTSPPLHTTLSTSKATSGKREHIINEVLETEEGYMRHVRTIVQSYIPALKAHITPHDKSTVFLNIEDIYTLHLNFYRELSAPPNDEPDCTEKADISAFLRYKDRFLIYAHYCTHLEESQKRVNHLIKNPIIQNIVEELNRKLQRAVSLKDQLAVCFQRVLRYKLLLAELFKNTPITHQKHHVIENALIAMEDVANYINEFKRDYEVVLEIGHIQSTLKFPSELAGGLKSLCAEFGRHMHDGELQVQFQGTEKRKIRNAFLFEKALLLCKQHGEFNEVHHILYLHEITVKDSQLSWKGKFVKTEGKISYCFTLRVGEESDSANPVRSCRIFSKNEQLKRSWMGAIRICIQVITLQEYEGKLNNHLFRLTTFDCGEYDTCDVCQKLLVGQISQGYLCGNGDCELLVHKNCLENCPPCGNSSPENSPSMPDRIATNNTISPEVINRKAAKEVSALTINQSTKNQALHNENWFSGPLSREQTEDLLSGFPDGSFLIRENRDELLVLSVQCNGNSFHIKIKEDLGQFYLSDSRKFTSIEEIISYYKANSLGNSFPQLPTVLTELIKTSNYENKPDEFL